MTGILTSRVGAWAQRGWSALRGVETRILLMALGAMALVWGFLTIHGEVREQETSRFDRSILLAFRVPGQLATPIGPRWLQETARDVTAFGGFTTLTFISIMAVALLLLNHRRKQALIVGLTVALSQLAAEGAKGFIGRARPDLVPHLDLVYSSSFPSGHAMMTSVVYLTLAAILAAGSDRRSVKALLLFAAVLVVAGVGVSRVYLGVHWPTDVLAGWTIGTAISLMASIALHLSAPAKTPDAAVQPDQN